MAEIKLTTRMESRIVADKFKTTWDVSLRFYYLSRNATTGWRLSELSDKKNGELLVTDSMTIGQFRKAAEEQFGGQILVFDSKDSFIVDDDVTFASARTWNVNIKNEIVITDNVPVDYVCRLFKATFGATLYLYDKSDSTYPAPSIEGWGKTIGRYFNYPTPLGHSSTESIKCTSDTKVADFISSMEKTFGIMAKIGNAKGELLKSNNITISDAKKADGIPFDKNIASPLWYIEKLGSQFKSIYGVSLKYNGSNYRLNQNSNNSNAKYDLTVKTTVGEFCNTINTIFGHTIAVVDSYSNIIPGNINLADASKWKFDPSKGFQIIPGMPIDWLNNRLYDKLIVAKLGNGSSLYNKTAKYITCTDDMTVDKLKKEIKSCYGNDIDFLSITEKPIPGNLTLGGLPDYVRENGFDINSKTKIGGLKSIFANVYCIDVHILNKKSEDTGDNWNGYCLDNDYLFGNVPSNVSYHISSSKTVGELSNEITSTMGINIIVTNKKSIAFPPQTPILDAAKWNFKNSFMITNIMKIGELKTFFKETFGVVVNLIKNNGEDTRDNWDNYQLNNNYLFGSVPTFATYICTKSNTVKELIEGIKKNLGIHITLNKQVIGIHEDTKISELKDVNISESFVIPNNIQLGELKSFFKETFGVVVHVFKINGEDTRDGWNNYQLNSNYLFGSVPTHASCVCTKNNTVKELVEGVKNKLGIQISLSNQEIGIHEDTKISELKNVNTTESFMIPSNMQIGELKSFLKETFGAAVHVFKTNGEDTHDGWNNYQLNHSYLFTNVPKICFFNCHSSITISKFCDKFKEILGIKIEIEGDQNRTLDRDLPQKPKKAEKNEVSAKEKTTEKKQEVKYPTAESPKPSPKTMRQSPKPKQDSTSETTQTPVREAAPAQEPTPAPQQKPQPVSVPKSEPKSPASNTGVDPAAKFAFNGTPYNIKGRLCHDIVKFYAEQHSDITLDLLKETFNIIKTDLIVASYKEAMNTKDSVGNIAGNYYIKDDDHIILKDKTHTVIFNYWPERNFIKFIECVNKLGYEVEIRYTNKTAEPTTVKNETIKNETIKKETIKKETVKGGPTQDELFALDRLIDAALEDFVVTDEERKILLNKVKAIGMNQDEFTLILNSKIEKRLKEKPVDKPEEKKKGFFARLFGK